MLPSIELIARNSSFVCRRHGAHFGLRRGRPLPFGLTVWLLGSGISTDIRIAEMNIVGHLLSWNFCRIRRYFFFGQNLWVTNLITNLLLTDLLWKICVESSKCEIGNLREIALGTLNVKIVRNGLHLRGKPLISFPYVHVHKIASLICCMIGCRLLKMPLACFNSMLHTKWTIRRRLNFDASKCNDGNASIFCYVWPQVHSPPQNSALHNKWSFLLLLKCSAFPFFEALKNCHIRHLPILTFFNYEC